jgi:hypothetical protein
MCVHLQAYETPTVYQLLLAGQRHSWKARCRRRVCLHLSPQPSSPGVLRLEGPVHLQSMLVHANKLVLPTLYLNPFGICLPESGYVQ